MKNLFLILALIFGCSCASVYTGKDGNLKAITLARNINTSNCNGCTDLIISAENYQSGALTSVSNGFFNTLKSVATAILPRGMSSE